MLTTEVVKGLIAGKVYRRTVPTPFNTWEEIKLREYQFLARNNSEKEWVPDTFGKVQLEADWEEVTEWQEIPWQEAVECYNRGIALQWSWRNEWLNYKAQLNLETLGFVQEQTWRKKVEVKNG